MEDFLQKAKFNMKSIISNLPVKWNCIHYNDFKKEVNIWYKEYHIKSNVTIPKNFRVDWLDNELKIGVKKILKKIFGNNRYYSSEPRRFFINPYGFNKVNIYEGIMSNYIPKNENDDEYCSSYFSINGKNFYDKGDIVFMEKI